MRRAVPPPSQKFPVKAGALQRRALSGAPVGRPSAAPPPQKFPVAGALQRQAQPAAPGSRPVAAPPPQKFPAAGAARGASAQAATGSAPPPQKFPVGGTHPRAIQRMVLPQQSVPQLPLLAGPSDSLETETARAKKTAKEYADYLDWYESVWGRLPWQSRPQKSGGYVFEQDPKQRARDQMEYFKARALLRREGELAEIRAACEKIGSNAVTNFDALVFLHANAQAAANALRAIDDPEARRLAALDWQKRWQTLLGRQIIGEQDVQGMVDAPENLVEFFRNGLDRLLDLYRSGEDTAHMLGEVLDHDKGYPRMINFLWDYVPPSRVRIGPMVSEFFNRFSNTRLFAGAPLELRNKSRGEQTKAYWSKASKAEKAGFWADLCGQILNAMNGRVPYEKKAFCDFIRPRVNELVAALNGYIPAAEIREFFASDDLEAMCDAMYMG